jgi:hypothetical protein
MTRPHAPIKRGTTSGHHADIGGMQWLYYVGIAVAVVVVLNVLLMVYLALVSREHD